MGEVIRPWQFWIQSYVKWQIEQKRAKDARDEALRASREGAVRRIEPYQRPDLFAVQYLRQLARTAEKFHASNLDMGLGVGDGRRRECRGK